MTNNSTHLRTDLAWTTPGGTKIIPVDIPVMSIRMYEVRGHGVRHIRYSRAAAKRLATVLDTMNLN